MFSQVNGSDSQEEIVRANIMEFLFTGLSERTLHMARVAGNNSRGFGIYSELVTGGTYVDDKGNHHGCINLRAGS